MKRALKWKWNYGLNEFFANKGGNEYAVGYDANDSICAFVCYKGENMWRILHMEPLQSIGEGFALCESHYAEIQTWK